jgi:hypothetical protein
LVFLLIWSFDDSLSLAMTMGWVHDEAPVVLVLLILAVEIYQLSTHLIMVTNINSIFCVCVTKNKQPEKHAPWAGGKQFEETIHRALLKYSYMHLITL